MATWTAPPAAADLILAVQGLRNAIRAVEIRTDWAESLIKAEQAGRGGAEEERVEAVGEALGILRRPGVAVAVAVTTGDARPRKADLALGPTW